MAIKPLNSYFNYEVRYQFINYLVYLNADIKPITFFSHNNLDMQFFISTINSIIEFCILILKKSFESLFYLLNIKPTPVEFILDYEGMPFSNQAEQEANEEKRNHILLMENDEEKKTSNISDSQTGATREKMRTTMIYQRTQLELQKAKYL
jgi:hypothetical protein